MKDIKIECIKGNKHAGGTHRNCTNSCVRATHIPTGLSVTIDERNQHANKKKAIKMLKQKIREWKEDQRAILRKERRDTKIKEKKYIRTYNFKRNEVKDHRNGKTAPLDKVMAGQIDLLYEDQKSGKV